MVRLSTEGVTISREHKQFVRAEGGGPELDGRPEEPRDITDGRGHLWLTEAQAEKARNRSEDPQLNAESYLGRIPEEWIAEWGDKSVTKEDWLPERVDVHDEEFRRFVSSHIPRFDRLIPYKRFWLYIKQAQDWLAEGTTAADYEGQDQWEFVQQEFARMNENRLYAMDKYGWIKDDDLPSGRRKYYASAPQAMLIFLMDCGYSCELGKGRQAAATSTVMLYEAITMLVRTSYKGVLVTDDVEFTGKNIFNDKLKMSYKYLVTLNPWMKPPDVPHTSEKKLMFDWSEGSNKSEKKTITAEYSLAASDDTQTINGTTPSKVVFDETQNIPTYTAIKMEARQPMLSSGEDGTIRVKRQLLAYGTGSSHQRGKGAFESEYLSTRTKWFEGKDTSSFVPMFWDWTCRPNMTTKRYLTERQYYLDNSKEEMKGMSVEERKSMFHAAMPSSPEDMFLTSHKTILPQMFIKEQQDRISHVKGLHSQGELVEFGRFEPIYDPGIPMPEGSPVPYFIKGAKWIPMGADAFDAPIRMLLPPEPNWAYRYYQGTDPIQSSSGTSLFASAIWDNVGYWREIDGQLIHEPTIACMLNDRTTIIEQTFLQSKLMGIYYANHNQRSCREVFEVNQGQAYERYICSPWMNLRDSLWRKDALPNKYRGGGHLYGVDLKKGSKQTLYYDTVAFLMDHYKNIWYWDFFTQVRNIDVEETEKGDIQWGTENRKIFQDDMVFAASYAYISCRADNKDPKQIDPQKPETVKKTKWVHNPQTLELTPITYDAPVRY